jgi:integrase/recombinase XerD
LLVQQFARHFGKSPENLGAEQVREYLLYLMRDKKAAANAVLLCRAALRFLYLYTLKKSWFDESIPHPKRRAVSPGILSPYEITCMLDRTVNLKHWTILAILYATALRCGELQHLKIQDIDSERMLIHVREAKGRSAAPDSTFACLARAIARLRPPVSTAGLVVSFHPKRQRAFG